MGLWDQLNCHLVLVINSVDLVEIFQESIADAFLEKLVKWCENIKISNPLEEGCRLGPVVSAQQVRKHLCILCLRILQEYH